MQLVEAQEVRDIVDRMSAAILSVLPSRSSVSTPELKQIVGLMRADDVNMLHLQTYSAAASMAMDIARMAGATMAGMALVRLAAMAEAPRSLPGTQTVLATIRLCLAQEARIAASIKYRSRDDVEIVSRRMNAAFDAAALRASDDLDAGTYSAIIMAQAKLTRFLADKGRERPRVIDFHMTDTFTTLHISQRLYGNGGRSQEILDENKIVHPAFAPRDIRALAL